MQEDDAFGFSAFRGSEPWLLSTGLDAAVELGCKSVAFGLHNGLGKQVGRDVAAQATTEASARSLEVRTACTDVDEPYALTCLPDDAPDCVVISSPLGSDYLRLRPAGYQNVKHILLGPASTQDYKAVDSNGESLLGARLFMWPDVDEARAATFRRAYEDLFGPDPNSLYHAMHFYDYVALGLLAIEAAKSTDGPLVRDAIRRIGGSSGTVVVGPTQLAEGLRSLRSGVHTTYRGASNSSDYSQSVWATPETSPTCEIITGIDPLEFKDCP